MKRLFLLMIMLFSFLPTSTLAKVTRREVSYINCSSATTCWLKDNSGELIRIRLLAYDSDDTTLNKEIEDYVNTQLKTATKIEIEIDDAASSLDIYNRQPVWLFVDGELWQYHLISLGYGQVNYVEAPYKYVDKLCQVEKEAFKQKLGIWQFATVTEKYCQSGERETTVLESAPVISSKTAKDTASLWYLVFLNSGIVLLLLSLKIKRLP